MFPPDHEYFLGRALFDRDVLAGRAVPIDGVDRSDNVERHPVAFGQHGELIGPDLVGGVAVGGNSVGPGEDCM